MDVSHSFPAQACARAGDFSNATALRRAMEAEDRVAPNLRTFRALVSAAGNAGEWAAAEALLDEVRAAFAARDGDDKGWRLRDYAACHEAALFACQDRGDYARAAAVLGRVEADVDARLAAAGRDGDALDFTLRGHVAAVGACAAFRGPAEGEDRGPVLRVGAFDLHFDSGCVGEVLRVAGASMVLCGTGAPPALNLSGGLLQALLYDEEGLTTQIAVARAVEMGVAVEVETQAQRDMDAFLKHKQDTDISFESQAPPLTLYKGDKTNRYSHTYIDVGGAYVMTLALGHRPPKKENGRHSALVLTDDGVYSRDPGLCAVRMLREVKGADNEKHDLYLSLAGLHICPHPNSTTLCLVLIQEERKGKVLRTALLCSMGGAAFFWPTHAVYWITGTRANPGVAADWAPDVYDLPPVLRFLWRGGVAPYHEEDMETWLKATSMESGNMGFLLSLALVEHLSYLRLFNLNLHAGNMAIARFHAKRLGKAIERVKMDGAMWAVATSTKNMSWGPDGYLARAGNRDAFRPPSDE